MFLLLAHRDQVALESGTHGKNLWRALVHLTQAGGMNTPMKGEVMLEGASGGVWGE